MKLVKIPVLGLGGGGQTLTIAGDNHELRQRKRASRRQCLIREEFSFLLNDVLKVERGATSNGGVSIRCD